jgi:hypothetical protein
LPIWERPHHAGRTYDAAAAAHAPAAALLRILACSLRHACHFSGKLLLGQKHPVLLVINDQVQRVQPFLAVQVCRVRFGSVWLSRMQQGLAGSVCPYWGSLAALLLACCFSLVGELHYHEVVETCRGTF